MYLLEKRGMRGALVRSLTTTGMVDRLGELFGVPVYELQVGFKYIGPKMTETDALIGGEMYLRVGENPPRELAGEAVVRSRSDDGFKFYLADGSWALVRFSGTEPLIRVYSEASTPERVQQLLAALERFLGIQAPTAGAAH
jgi:phosphomannomutase